MGQGGGGRERLDGRAAALAGGVGEVVAQPARVERVELAGEPRAADDVDLLAVVSDLVGDALGEKVEARVLSGAVWQALVELEMRSLAQAAQRAV